MTERATIDYVTDAKVGDFVWCLDGNATVYSPDGKYKGRGKWRLCEITKMAKKYFTVKKETWGSQDFEIGTGRPRSVNGFQPPDHAYGEIEKWAADNRRRVEKTVERLSAAQLRQVAAFIETNVTPIQE